MCLYVRHAEETRATIASRVRATHPKRDAHVTAVSGRDYESSANHPQETIIYDYFSEPSESQQKGNERGINTEREALL